MYLKELSEINGVSGNEQKVRDFILDKIKDKVDKYWIDRMGNLIVFKKGKSKAKVVLDAHMDEVGFMVTKINDDGTLSFMPVGGVDPRVVIGKKVIINDEIVGIIGFKAIHLQDSPYKTPEFSQLSIDAGFSSKKEAEKKVKIGDYVAFTTKYKEVGNFATGKAFDDRGGCSILIDLIEKNIKTDYDLYFVFSVQEETGLRGSAVVAEQIQPDFAIAIETTTAGDNPELDKELWATHLGEGPAITFMHSGYVIDKNLFESLVKTAKDNNIPFQYKRRTAGGTNAARYARSAYGIPSAVISIPSRYIHSPLIVINLEDYKNTVLLLQKFLEEAPIK
ncbi:peptidase M42 [Thermosipho melanesiensis]|uniref:Cellulase n=2 Tax=Thermosipho melanesiensis TaxID=46541 RepID=A6LJ73_THEM4|nr:M42 family metallopeptidase [Thermosipho melanesiensis]ABR29974.1 Cellulase [Thermosipho melanesiensis BI429]APT73178.1 peptidase M42 [Thermosipho melanesiensis]OOC38574.1 peptidase M42 [Thermosipho melanesiensis]OOC40378.1 peptidase M42 [Thermosipho melanesiensis]OOC40642.1 peptidase M42 [Thermosipho melanesiensis]